MIAQDIKEWFARAVPTPNDKNRAVQLGVHFEEVDEMCEALGMPPSDMLRQALCENADDLKTQTEVSMRLFSDAEKVALLDSLCDQIVTAIGVGHMMGFNIIDALREVNGSNWSKFVEHQPVFDANGKIKKGPSYRKPDLTKFIGN